MLRQEHTGPTVGAVLTIICGFLMAVSCWRCILHCIVIVRSFLRLLKLRKLAFCKLDLSGGGGLTQCHDVLDHGLSFYRNIPLKYSLSELLVGLQTSGVLCIKHSNARHVYPTAQCLNKSKNDTV